MTENTTPKQRGGFKPGQSGNPAGKPKGARNKATRAAEVLFAGELNEICRKLIESAKAGDVTAARVIIDRILPPARERPMSFEMPSITSVSELPNALVRVVEGLASGQILPSEAECLARLLDVTRRSMEVAQLEERLTQVEQRLEEEARHGQ